MNRPLVAWLGDDFTGSAAVMEVLAFAGLPAVLFTDIPDPALAARFAGAAGIGIATTARSHAPDWMAAHLPAPLGWLHALGAPLLHYKICSTFDSAPRMGSIGRAIEVALTVRPSAAVPLLTAAPAMRRYQAFGHLFRRHGRGCLPSRSAPGHGPSPGHPDGRSRSPPPPRGADRSALGADRP
jgi:3-oxoisoapionate kinase